MRGPFCLLLLVGLTGCVTYSQSVPCLTRGTLEARLRDESDKVIDKDIKDIQTLAPQIRFPCRIAVAIRSEGRGEWRWTGKDRQVMHAWAETLRKEGVATDVVFMSKMFTNADDLRSLRASAAKYGADALLLIKGIAATESRLNALAAFNATIVGGFVFPGSHRDALFQIEGCLVDVNNGFLYLTVETEGESSVLAPTFVIEERDAIDKAKGDALTAFGPELLNSLRNLRELRAQPGKEPIVRPSAALLSPPSPPSPPLPEAPAAPRWKKGS